MNLTQMHYIQTGFTDSPRADTAKLVAKTFRATLMSWSWIMPHSGQFHLRIINGLLATIYPQSVHRLLDGYQCSMPISVRSYQCALYSSCRVSSDQLASLIEFDRQRFFCMLLTANVSMAITWFSLISLVEGLLWKPLLELAVLACIRATLSLALALVQLAQLLVCLTNRRYSVASRDWLSLKMLGTAIFSRVERMPKWIKPKSILTLPNTFALIITTSLQSTETKYLPAASFGTVTVVSLEALGNVRDDRIKRGSGIFASFKVLRFQLKVLVVCPADCLSCLTLKNRYLARLAKKLLKGVCRWRNAFCTGMLEISFSHTNSDSFFNAVNTAETS